MCIDCVLASPRIAQVDPGDEPLSEVVLSHFTLGNAVPEPFFEDFQDQAFEESQLFFVDQQGKLP
jgi:hypothetical protein